MFLAILIIIIAVSAIVAFVLGIANKNKAGWVLFYAKGKDSGFTFKEIELLRKLAVKSNLDDPSSLFWSQNQLDLCIRSFVKSLHLIGATNDQESHDFLSKLYDFRKKIEMEKPKIKHGIASTRQISEGQNLRILAGNSGVFRSQIVKNTQQYIAISRPVSVKATGNMSWHGMKVSVYFWREDDAGYVFDTDVQDEVFSKGIASLKIGHATSLFRTQKRKSIRIKTHKAAFLYMLNDENSVYTIEEGPGLKCFLEDLSEAGCAVTIGGKATAGMRIKVQFVLNNKPICMSGTVRSVDYKEDMNRSLLHVEADLLPLDVRNQILGEVFNMLPEDEEELPFRLLDEEAEEMAAAEETEESGTAPDLSDSDDAGKTKTAV